MVARNRGRVRSERRKLDAEYCAALRPVLACDLSVVLLNDAIAGAQAEPGSVAYRPCRVKGIENPSRFFNPGSIIGKIQLNMIAAEVRPDRQIPPTWRHRLHRIRGQVQKYLKKLIGIPAIFGKFPPRSVLTSTLAVRSCG